jgi:arsenate reductase-like glutaredoxin family protein
MCDIKIIEAMLRDPKLIEKPFIIKDKNSILRRQPKKTLIMLDYDGI